MLNNFKITEGEKLFIDGVELKSVTHYELHHSAGKEAELTVKMEVIVDQASKQLSNIRTKDLVEELRTREGVETKYAEPYQDLDISVNGPAIILIVTD